MCLSFICWIILFEITFGCILQTGRATMPSRVRSAWYKYHMLQKCDAHKCGNKVWLFGDSTSPHYPMTEADNPVLSFSSVGILTLAGVYYIMDTLLKKEIHPKAVVILMRTESWFITEKGVRPPNYFDQGFVTPFAEPGRIIDLAKIHPAFAVRMAINGLIPSLRLRSESAELLRHHHFTPSVPTFDVPEAYQHKLKMIQKEPFRIDSFQKVFFERIIRLAQKHGFPIYLGHTYYSESVIAKQRHRADGLDAFFELLESEHKGVIYRINKTYPVYPDHLFTDSIHLAEGEIKNKFKSDILSEITAVANNDAVG